MAAPVPTNMEEAIEMIREMNDDLGVEVRHRMQVEEQYQEAKDEIDQLIAEKNQRLDSRDDRIDALVEQCKSIERSLEIETDARIAAESSYNALASLRPQVQPTPTPTPIPTTTIQQPIDEESIAKPYVDEVIRRANILLQQATEEKEALVRQYWTDLREKDTQIAVLESQLQSMAAEKEIAQEKAAEYHSQMMKEALDSLAASNLAEENAGKLKEEERRRIEAETKRDELNEQLNILKAGLEERKLEANSTTQIPKKDTEVAAGPSNSGTVSQPTTNNVQDNSTNSDPKSTTQASGSELPRTSALVRQKNEEIAKLKRLALHRLEEAEAQREEVEDLTAKVKELEAIKFHLEYVKREHVRRENELTKKLEAALNPPPTTSMSKDNPIDYNAGPGFFKTLIVCLGVGLMGVVGERGYLW